MRKRKEATGRTPFQKMESCPLPAAVSLKLAHLLQNDFLQRTLPGSIVAGSDIQNCAPTSDTANTVQRIIPHAQRTRAPNNKREHMSRLTLEETLNQQRRKGPCPYLGD